MWIEVSIHGLAGNEIFFTGFDERIIMEYLPFKNARTEATIFLQGILEMCGEVPLNSGDSRVLLLRAADASRYLYDL